MPFEMQHDFRDRVPIFHEEHGRVEEPKTRVDQLRALLNHVLRQGGCVDNNSLDLASGKPCQSFDPLGHYALNRVDVLS